MIEGSVNAAYEAVVTFPLQDPEGRTQDIEADATGTTPLVGTLPLDRYNMNIEVERGGRVSTGLNLRRGRRRA